MSHESARSFNDPVTVSIRPDCDRWLSNHTNRRCRLDDTQCAPAVHAPLTVASPRWATVVVRGFICSLILVAVGCGQGQTGAQKFNEDEAKAQKEELLKKYPVSPPDTPEQVLEKEAKIEETLPKVYELLEAAKQDPKKADEAVELSMSLLTQVPGHRAAKVAYCKAQLAAFFANEPTDENGNVIDEFEFNMAVAIRSACLEIDRLQETFEDLSEEEKQLCQEVYFNRARLDGLYPDGSDTGLFNAAINKLMSAGFQDAERLKSEPRFQPYFTNPETAPVLKAALAKIEASGQDEGNQ